MVVRNGDISAQAGPTWSCSLGVGACGRDSRTRDQCDEVWRALYLGKSGCCLVGCGVQRVPHIRFTWTESGGPPVSAPAPKASARVSLNRCWDALLPER